MTKVPQESDLLVPFEIENLRTHLPRVFLVNANAKMRIAMELASKATCRSVDQSCAMPSSGQLSGTP